MTKKELIIHHFEKMNIRMLDILLDDSKTYQCTPKDFFLEKLELAFNEFRNLNDTYLSSYKGKCCNKECSNHGCSGFSFVGNVSGRSIDLIFEDTDTDFADIYQCFGFESDYNPENKLWPISLDIKQDEQTDFKPGIDFLIQSQKCRNAYEELKNAANGKMIDREIYLNWLEKYRALFDEFVLPPILYRSLENFYYLYYSLNNLSSNIKFDVDAGNAYQDYLLNLPSDENILLQWLCKFEQLGNQLILFPYPDNLSAKEIDKGYFIFDGIRINAVDYENIITFKKIFNKFYWEMLDKYRTTREVKADDLSEVVSITETEDSLSFHLEKLKGKIH
jgi:hypothetical protein